MSTEAGHTGITVHGYVLVFVHEGTGDVFHVKHSSRIKICVVFLQLKSDKGKKYFTCIL